MLTQVLLLLKTLVGFQNFQGETALYLATDRNQTKVVKTLLDLGANPNLANLDGVTPFHIACANGVLEIVKMLKQSGVNVNSQDDSGDSKQKKAKNRQ